MSSVSKKLIIIDGNAILHRAFHAIPPLNAPDGKIVNAVYGFTSILIKILKDLSPDYVAATFDLAGPTFRHEEFQEYKAHRVKSPDELYAQIPPVKDVLKSLGIPVLEKEGYEADDVLGTIATKAKANKDLQIIIATGDLDTLQLVDKKNIVVFTMRKGLTDTVMYDEKAVIARYDLKPEQLVDYRGLKGDPSDNIPGVPGIGEKTASMLIHVFGSLENLYKQVEKGEPKESAKELGLSEKMIIKLREHKEAALQAKRLSTIICDLPLEFNLKDMDWRKNLELSQVEKTLRSFGFFSLVKRLPEIGLTAQAGLELTTAKPPEKKSQFKPQSDTFFVYSEGDELTAEILQDSKYTVVGHDIKETLKPFVQEGIEIKAKLFDTYLASYLLSPDARDYDFERIYYACFKESENAKQGPECLWQLKEYLETQLQSAALMEVFENIEIPLIQVLAEMEGHGIKIDTKLLDKLLRLANKEIDQLETKIHKLADTDFNINSPKQLGEVLFNRLGLVAKIKKTGGGALSTAASELEKMRDLHPIIELIMQYRELQKLRTTYIEPFPILIAADGRIHTTYNQTGTGTGRLSSQDPNLQNIPIKTELGQEFRRAFIAEEEYQLVSFDYTQLELRIAAHIAKDQKMIETFNRGEDIHTRTAVEIFKVKPEEVDKEMRRQAKVLNFGIIYGMGSVSFARAAGIDRTTAKNFISKYFEEFSGVARYMEDTKQLAHDQGYVETIFGRKRKLPDIRSTMPMLRSGAERAAINHPIQGTEADLVKLAMIEIHKYLHSSPVASSQSLGVRLLLQVHDEIVLEIKKEDVQKTAKEIKEIMESVYKLDVPLTVDVKAGNNWWDMEKLKI